MAEEEKKEKKEKKHPVVEIYEDGGMQAVVDALGLPVRQVLEEVSQLASKVPALPEAKQVFDVFDKVKDKPKNEPVVPVLALMGLKADNLAPGTHPWSLRKNDTGKDVLTLSLSNGKKVFWVRE